MDYKPPKHNPLRINTPGDHLRFIVRHNYRCKHIVCAWCRETMRIEPLDPKGTRTLLTHGICEQCSTNMISRWREQRESAV